MIPPGGDAEDTEALRCKWDSRYRATDRFPDPAGVLLENRHLLPTRGRALDLASGLGANALLLARWGLSVSAWDLSPVAIAALKTRAAAEGLALEAEVRDVLCHPPAPARFDVILVSHFLARDLAPAISAALLPGGLLFYQTFVRESVTDQGPGNPAYRLNRNELLRLFSDLVVRFYREEGRVGDLDRGTRDVAQLVAQRP